MILETHLPPKKLRLIRVNNPKVGDIIFSVRGLGTPNQHAIQEILLEQISD